MDMIGMATLLGLVCLCASVIGGTVAAIVEHWLGRERDPAKAARWRVGPRALMERTRREIEASRSRRL